MLVQESSSENLKVMTALSKGQTRRCAVANCYFSEIKNLQPFPLSTVMEAGMSDMHCSVRVISAAYSHTNRLYQSFITMTSAYPNNIYNIADSAFVKCIL